MELYRIGAISLERHPKHLPYGKANDLAQAAGLNPQTFRDARLLAFRIKPERMQELVGLCHKCQVTPSRSVFLRLLAAETAKWPELIALAGENGWSTHQLAREIQARDPTSKKRRHGVRGRKPHAAESERHFVVELRRFLTRGHRLLADPDRKAPKSLRVKHIPPRLRPRLEQLFKLLQVVEKALDDR